jgi:hypothetical protein
MIDTYPIYFKYLVFCFVFHFIPMQLGGVIVLLSYVKELKLLCLKSMK